MSVLDLNHMPGLAFILVYCFRLSVMSASGTALVALCVGGVCTHRTFPLYLFLLSFQLHFVPCGVGLAGRDQLSSFGFRPWYSVPKPSRCSWCQDEFVRRIVHTSRFVFVVD